jgi:hypothetical protein
VAIKKLQAESAAPTRQAMRKLIKKLIGAYLLAPILKLIGDEQGAKWVLSHYCADSTDGQSSATRPKNGPGAEDV